MPGPSWPPLGQQRPAGASCAASVSGPPAARAPGTPPASRSSRCGGPGGAERGTPGVSRSRGAPSSTFDLEEGPRRARAKGEGEDRGGAHLAAVPRVPAGSSSSRVRSSSEPELGLRLGAASAPPRPLNSPVSEAADRIRRCAELNPPSRFSIAARPTRPPPPLLFQRRPAPPAAPSRRPLRRDARPSRPGAGGPAPPSLAGPPARPPEGEVMCDFGGGEYQVQAGLSVPPTRKVRDAPIEQIGNDRRRNRKRFPFTINPPRLRKKPVPRPDFLQRSGARAGGARGGAPAGGAGRGRPAPDRANGGRAPLHGVQQVQQRCQRPRGELGRGAGAAG